MISRPLLLPGVVTLLALPWLANAANDQPSLRLSPSAVLAASLDGLAYDIHLVEASPQAIQVPTERPVLRYAGVSSDGGHLAYTTLETFDDAAPSNRRPIQSGETKPDLVPSGDLYVEDRLTRDLIRVDLDDHYVLAVAWAPHRKRLAYTFSSGSDFGLAIADLDQGQVRVARPDGVLADYLTWDAEGIHFFVRDGSIALTNGYESERFAPATLTTNFERRRRIRAGSSRLVAAERLFDRQGLELRLRDGTLLRGDSLVGTQRITVSSAESGQNETLENSTLEAMSADGAIVRIIDHSGGVEQLLHVGLGGSITTLASASTSVAYYLPFSSGTSIAVTQSGTSYSGACRIFSHKGDQSWAYDLQSQRVWDGIIAAASGTVAYLKKDVTCNSFDEKDCKAFVRNCTNRNSGFGNAVILQHANGRFTSYAHLRHGSVTPPRTGVSVSRGCHLGSQGHTGFTEGNLNGCGDHLHVQLQTGSKVTSLSTRIDWAGLKNPLTCTTYKSNNVGGRSCLFR